MMSSCVRANARPRFTGRAGRPLDSDIDVDDTSAGPKAGQLGQPYKNIGFLHHGCKNHCILQGFCTIGPKTLVIYKGFSTMGANTLVFYRVLERSRLQAQLIRHSKTNRLVGNPWRAHRGHTHPNKNANSLIGRVPREVLQVGPLGPLWLFVAVPCTCWSKTNIWPSWPALGPGLVQVARVPRLMHLRFAIARLLFKRGCRLGKCQWTMGHRTLQKPAREAPRRPVPLGKISARPN